VRYISRKLKFTTDFSTIPHANDTIAAGRIEPLLAGAAGVIIL
jgi:hypothetical protein